MTSSYASPWELVRFLNIEQTVPDRKATGSTRGRELVGTGDNSNLVFWLDKSYIIDNTYALYHGFPGASGTALTDITHYALDKDNGEITLTTTGKAVVGLGTVSAVYSYNDLELTNTQLQEALDRAQKDIDKKTNSHFAVGTQATPDYEKETNEKHTGKGKHDRDYFLDKFPIPDVSSPLASATHVGATTVWVDSTSGFPNSGYFGLANEKVPYGSKTSSAFYGITNQVSAVYEGGTSTAKVVYPYVFELSTTSSGTKPSWSVLEVDEDYDIDLNTGKVHLFVTEYDLTYYALQYPPRLIPNRFRASYIAGRDTIPDDIKRACLMLAAKDLMHAIGRKAGLHGMSLPEIPALNLDDTWINDTLESYKNRKHSNT